MISAYSVRCATKFEILCKQFTSFVVELVVALSSIPVDCRVPLSQTATLSHKFLVPNKVVKKNCVHTIHPLFTWGVLENFCETIFEIFGEWLGNFTDHMGTKCGLLGDRFGTTLLQNLQLQGDQSCTT